MERGAPEGVQEEDVIKKKRQEFEYYSLLLERLQNQSPLDWLKECEKMHTQTELIRQQIIQSMSKDPMATIAKQNGLKLRCCIELRKKLEPLEEIMGMLVEWNDLEVVYEDDFLRKILYGGSISRSQSLERTLEVIELSGGLRFIVQGRKVFVLRSVR